MVSGHIKHTSVSDVGLPTDGRGVSVGTALSEGPKLVVNELLSYPSSTATVGSTSTSIPNTTTTATTTTTTATGICMTSTVNPVDSIGSQLVVNELLAYTVYYRDNSSRALLMTVLGTFFSQLEITTAKKCLVASFRNTVSNTSFVTERRSSSTRSVHEAELDDILSLLEVIDGKNMLVSVTFVAANLGRLPGYAPEETNISAFVEKQTKMSTTLDQLSSAVKDLQVQSVNPVTEVEVKPSHAGVPSTGAATDGIVRESSVLNSLVNIQQKLDNIESVVSNLRCNSPAPSCSSGRGTTSSGVEPGISFEQAGSDSYNRELKSREKNLVLFGVPENNVRSAWCKCVTDVGLCCGATCRD